MRKHHSRIVKFSFSKRNQRPPQENTSPFPFLASSRDIDFLNPKGAELMKITQISPLPVKPCLTEGSQPLRITQHFRITRSPSPIKRRHDELNPRVAAFSSQGSFTGETQQENVRTDGSQDNRVAVLMERLEKKEQEKEKEKENIIKFTRQSQRIPRQQQIVIEEEKGEGVRFKAPSKEQISDSEMRKIMIFFRYRISLLAKLVEDKAHGGGNVKGIKPKLKLANLSASGASPYSPATSPVMGKTSMEPVGNEDVSAMDEVWRIVKFTASTRSKYKFRDVVNYNKRLRETVKSLFPLNLSNQRRMVSINLEDETPTKSPTKKIKFSEEDKANAYNDFVSQRKENPNTKVYIVIGAYPALRKALDERGWIENPDHYGKEFNLKWTSKVIDINYNALKPNQLVNHFADNILITTKVGLARNIRNLIWNENEDIDHYYPRCFDLNDVADFDDFLEDFKFEQAVSVLKAVRNRKEDISAQSYNLLKLKLCIAVGICEKRVRPFEMIVHNLAKSESMAFTQEEWELINAPESENVFESAKYTKLIRTLKTKYKVEFNDVTQCEADDKLLSDAESILTKLEKEFPQFALNQGKNIWIVKPSSLSRGRGICCYNSLASILDHIQIKESEWVAQKYIENPLIIKNRKFDIRQWVLVTDWSPLTIWFFDECYIRFSAHEFNPEDLTNKFAHLTNNAIGRNAANFETSEIDGNMWSEAELGAYMQEVNGTDVFNESIKKQMKNIIIKSMHSSPEIMESRKNTFELFGYDFMIDENYKTWMIEINSSPSMDYSTSITERLVKTLLEDIVKVVVDYGMSKAKNKKNINTGKFQCIYYGKPC